MTSFFHFFNFPIFVPFNFRQIFNFEESESCLRCKVIKTKAESDGSKYYTALISDCAKLIDQGSKLIKVLERMALEAPNEKEMPKVINLIATAKRTEEVVNTWALSYGFTGGGAKRRKTKGPA